MPAARSARARSASGRRPPRGTSRVSDPLLERRGHALQRCRVEDLRTVVDDPPPDVGLHTGLERGAVAPPLARVAVEGDGRSGLEALGADRADDVALHVAVHVRQRVGHRRVHVGPVLADLLARHALAEARDVDDLEAVARCGLPMTAPYAARTQRPRSRPAPHVASCRDVRAALLTEYGRPLEVE